jgi:thiol-disulfide isomerase/thioredoxin
MPSRSALSLLFASALVAQAPTQPEPLRIGSSAPAFQVSRTLKGKPHKALQKGQLYVVEFWATWCGPCRMSIPHLTELATKHAGKVTFIGVDVWERPKTGENLNQLVDAFVKEMGPKMGYDVAQDTEEGHMAKAWLKAAEAPGIPMAFVVDAQGRIAWMGHPMELDPVLENLLAGKHDLTTASANYEKQRAERKLKQQQMESLRKAMSGVNPGIEEARQAKDYAGMLARVDQAIASNSNLKESLKAPRFEAMLHVNEVQAQATFEADEDSRDMYCSTISREVGLSKSWYEKAARFFEVEGAKPSSAPMIQVGLARTYFQLGRAKEAAAILEKVLAKARQEKVPEGQLKDLVLNLQTYKDAK